MTIKKSLICIIAIAFSVVLCACAGNKINSEPDPAAVTDLTKDTEVSIPTDSGLADSVFDNAANPTKPDTDSTTGNTNTDNSVDVTTPEDTTESEDITSPSTGATAPTTPPEKMTYEEFIELTPEEQRLYQESFNDLDAFFAWYSAAKEKYEKENPPIDIDGPIDLGKY